MQPRTAGLVAAGSLVAFAVLAIAVKFIPSMQSADLQSALWVNNLQLGNAVDSMLVNASLYGREYFWIPIVAILVLFGDRDTKLTGIGLAAVFIVGIISGEVAKDVVARMRPGQVLSAGGSGVTGTIVVRIPLDTDFSFPSGHALIVSIGAFYSLLAFKRKWLAGLLTLEAAVVCVSRVYTFEHFPTDVLGGILLGAAIAFAGIYAGRTFLKSLYEALADLLVKALRSGPLKV